MILELPDDSEYKLLDNAKVQLALYALAHSNNQEEAAEKLGISSRAFREWLGRYDELKRFKKYIDRPKCRYPDNDYEWKRSTYV